MDAKFFENLEAAKRDAALISDGQQFTDMRRVRGQEKQAELVNEYRLYIKDSSAAIILVGEGQTSFAKRAEEEGDTLTLDASLTYHDLFKGLWESMGGTGRFTLDQMIALHARLDKFAKHRNIDIFRMPTFDTTLNTFHEDKDSFLRCLRRELVHTLGAFVVIGGLQNQLFTAAIAAQATNMPLPVVIVNAIESEIPPLNLSFSGRTIVVDAQEEVVEVFKQLLNKLKTKEENNG